MNVAEAFLLGSYKHRRYATAFNVDIFEMKVEFVIFNHSS